MSAEGWRAGDQIAAIRKRPAMYIGTLGFFGIIHYLVSPVAMLLARRPGRLGVAVEEDGFAVEADAALPIEELPDGRLVPFEAAPMIGPGHDLEGTVLCALSERLEVEVRRGDRLDVIDFRLGHRERHRISAIEPEGDRTVLRFAPDRAIFTVTDLDPAIFESFLRRGSFLNRGVRFSFSAGERSVEFRSERGIADLFTSVVAPYQILHEPIRIEGEEGTMGLEAVFAYHSTGEDALWCFINNGRAVEGGTHEDGVRDALHHLGGVLGVWKGRKSRHDNGVVGVVSIRYPGATWEGCIKARIGNPELRPMVHELFVRRSLEWLEARPEADARIRQIQTFQFPDAWGR